MVKQVMLMAGAPKSGAPIDVWKNKDAILELIQEAKDHQVKALVLPELALSTSGAGSLFLHAHFLSACLDAAHDIAQECVGLACVFGLPVQHGSKTYNALAVAYDGQIQAFVIKQNLQKEQASFFGTDCPGSINVRGRDIPCARQAEVPLAVSAAAVFYDDLETIKPDADLVLAPALLPAEAGRLDAYSLLREQFSAPVLVIANAGSNESTTDLVYPGQAAIFENGEPKAFAHAFKQESAVWALELPLIKQTGLNPPSAGWQADRRMPYAPQDRDALARWCEDAVEISAQALAARMRRIGIKAVTLGVSGGLDSAMALVTSLKAFDILNLDKKGVYAYSLPGLGSSERTKKNAVKLMEAFDLEPREINLQASILQHFKDIDQDIDTHDAAYENAQARERTQVLMDKANQVNGMMVGSGDLSELALGFTTFNGDHMSMYGVNGGLYKTAIRLILRHVAEMTDKALLKETLLDILATPISPELLPGHGDIKQKTEDILGLMNSTTSSSTCS